MINASESINVLTTEICKHAVTCFWGGYPGNLHLIFTLSTYNVLSLCDAENEMPTTNCFCYQP
jgi:hypothetical protein